MGLEWILFLAVLIGGAIPLLRKRLFAALFLCGATVFGAVKWTVWQNRRTAERMETARSLPREGRPGGYVTSDTCRSCHPDQHASWHRSFHRTMTQYATPQAVRGDFNGVSLELDGEAYKFERIGDEFWVELVDPDLKLIHPELRARKRAERVWRRVGIVTGSHHMQAYWVPSATGNLQINLPFTYLFSEGRWVPRNSAFLMDPASPTLVQMWNANCLQCHATAGQPRPEIDSHFIVDTRLGEMGISCEACHGPAEAHVRAYQNPLARYLERDDAQADHRIVNPAKLDHRTSTQVCGQCHSIRMIPAGHPWRYEGFSYRPGDDLEKYIPVVRPLAHANEAWFKKGVAAEPNYVEDRFWSDGMVRISGREFNGMLETPCYQRGKMSCLSCHSMHESDPNDQLGAGMESNQACLQCHTDLKVNEHTRHPAGSSGSLCYNCHMPHTTYGLMKAIRSHTVDSPSVAATLQTGRPNACNLCHLDQTLAWTGRHLTEWYGQPPPALSDDQRKIPEAALWALRGDAGLRALTAWHFGWEPARQVSGDGWFAPLLAQLLDDPYPTVRYIAGHSLKRVAGFNDFAYDYVAPIPARHQARAAAISRWQQQRSPDLRPGLMLDPATWNRLLQERDNKSMYLKE